MNHKAKIKLARKLRTPGEEKSGVGLFQSAGWHRRKDAIKQKELNKQKKEIPTAKVPQLDEAQEICRHCFEKRGKMKYGPHGLDHYNALFRFLYISGLLKIWSKTMSIFGMHSYYDDSLG